MHYPDSRSHRLQGYDYSQPGWYFVTLSTQNMSCLFGHVRNGIINLTDAGAMIERVWQELTVYSSRIDLDIFQVMPNHFHGILIIRADLEQVPIIPMDAGHGDPAQQQHARLNCRKHAGHGDPAQQQHARLNCTLETRRARGPCETAACKTKLQETRGGRARSITVNTRLDRSF